MIFKLSIVIITQRRRRLQIMSEEYKIIAEDVYKTFNVYLDKANYYFYFQETEKKKGKY